MKKPRKLNVVMLPIDEIKPELANEKLHPDDNIALLEKGLEEFDQQKAIVVDKDNTIIAGHGIWLAAKKLGYTHWNCTVSNLKGNKKKAYRIFDNKSAELSKWDDEKLSKTLYELHDDNYSMIDYGFEDAKDLEPQEPEFEFKPPNLDQSSTVEKLSLIVEFKNENEMDSLFMELNDRGFKVKRA